MRKLGLGLGIGRAKRAGAQIITATVTPTGQLFVGENASADLAQFATFDSVGNYSSTQANISSVDYQINGVSDTGSGVLAENDIPSFLVTDGAANTRRFSLSAVQLGQAANLSLLSVTGPQSGGDLPVAYTIDKDSGVSWGVGTGSTPTAAALRAGTGMTDFGTTTLTISGSPINLTLADGIDETSLNLWMVPDSSDTVTTATGSVPFAIDTAAPVLVPASCTPVDGATDVAVDSNITLIFDETVVAGTGNFYIYEGGVLSETIAVGSATIGTTDVVLNPVSDFTNDVDVSVRWDAGVVEDAQGNAVAANSTDTLLNFQTVAAVSSAPVEYLTNIAYSGASTTAQTFSFTLSSHGVSAGDKLLIGSGLRRQGTSGTFNSNSMSLVRDAGGTTGKRMSLFQYDVVAQDVIDDTVTIQMNLAAGSDEGYIVVLNAFGLDGSLIGVPDRVESDNSNDGSTLALTTTNISAGLTSMTLVMGDTAAFGPSMFALGTEQARVTGVGTNSDRGLAMATYIAPDSSSIAQTVTPAAAVNCAAIHFTLAP